MAVVDLSNRKEITREKIELCLDDEINLRFEGKDFRFNHFDDKIEVDPASIIKYCRPEIYEDYFYDYCQRNDIRIVDKEDDIQYWEAAE